MNIWVIILIALLLFGSSGYGFHTYGWQGGGGIGLGGLLLIAIVTKLLGLW